MQLYTALLLTVASVAALGQGYNLLVSHARGGGSPAASPPRRGDAAQLKVKSGGAPSSQAVAGPGRRRTQRGGSGGDRDGAGPGVAVYRANPKAACPVCDAAFIFYNRIPKAGSSSMLALIGLQQMGGKMVWVHSREFKDRVWLTPEEEQARTAAISDEVGKELAVASGRRRSRRSGSSPKQPAVLYDQHIRYLNFSRHGFRQPMFMNIMRDPVSRAVSSFYYSVAGPRKPEKIQKIVDKRGEQAGFNVNECVALSKNERHCGFGGLDRNLNTAFFCGHQNVCRCLNQGKLECTDSEYRAALEVAKHNVDRNYAVVGLMEQFNVTLALFEKIMPVHFAGVSKHVIPHARSTGDRSVYVPPTPDTVRALKDMFYLDYELYEFISARFHDQVARCLKKK